MFYQNEGNKMVEGLNCKNENDENRKIFKTS